MTAAVYRFVCLPSVLAGAPRSWAREMLQDGELALLPGDGLSAVDEVAHQLGLVSVPLLRGEDSREAQVDTVIAYAGSLPLVWVGEGFSDRVAEWARSRGPMTLLVDAAQPLSEDERKRIARFVASLGRQSE